MCEVTQESKVLKPLETGPRVQIMAALHYLTTLVAILSIATLVGGAGMIVYGAVTQQNWRVIVWGTLIMFSFILPAITTVVLGDILEPNKKRTADAMILYRSRKGIETDIIKDNQVNTLLSVHDHPKLKGAVLVRLQPQELGDYAIWRCALPKRLLPVLKPGNVVRLRRIGYDFHPHNIYDAQVKLVVHDAATDTVVGVTEIYSRENSQGIKGIDKNGFKVRKVVAN